MVGWDVVAVAGMRGVRQLRDALRPRLVWMSGTSDEWLFLAAQTGVGETGCGCGTPPGRLPPPMLPPSCVPLLVPVLDSWPGVRVGSAAGVAPKQGVIHGERAKRVDVRDKLKMEGPAAMQMMRPMRAACDCGGKDNGPWLGGRGGGGELKGGRRTFHFTQLSPPTSNGGEVRARPCRCGEADAGCECAGQPSLSRYVRQIAPNPRAGPRGINY